MCGMSMALSLDGAKNFPFQLATQNQYKNNAGTVRYQTEVLLLHHNALLQSCMAAESLTSMNSNNGYFHE